MAKVTLDTLLSGFKAITGYNSNNTTIQDELNNKVLYRNNPDGEPNQLENEIDMNSNKITNLAEPTNLNDGARLQDVQNAIAGDTAANLISVTPAGNISSTTAQGAIEELDDQTVLKVTTVAAMKLLSIAAGDIVSTQGYYTAGDGGGATYLIVTAQAFDGFGDHELTNGNIAVLQINDRANVHIFGAKGDGSTDDILAMQASVDYMEARGGGVILFNAALYMKSAQLDIGANITLQGAGQQATAIINNAANINGVFAGDLASNVGYGGIRDMTIKGDVSDTTNSILYFDPTWGYKHGRFTNLVLSQGGYGANGGDELWECEFNNVRSNSALVNSFRFVGATGSGSDNLLTKCYSNAVGRGAATGTGFEISASLRKSVMLNCTIGDTDSTDYQVDIGTSVLGLAIIGGNTEGFTLASGKAAFRIGSDSVVSIQSMAFQGVDGPGAGSAALISADNTAIITVDSCVQFLAGAGTLYSMQINSGTAKIYERGNSFQDSINVTTPSGGAIVRNEGTFIRRTSIPIDLSGAATTQILDLVPNRYGNLISAKILYSEATSADAGIVVEVGYSGDTNFLASITTGVSQAIWADEDMTIHDQRIGGWGGPILVTSPGGKTGTGEAYIVLEFTSIG